ncbi:hypothetical protein EDB83DRAFT_2419289, partial [Lactarius deliciosus]
ERAIAGSVERWEERLVFGSDRLYKQQDIEKQRGIIVGYLDTVYEVLFGGSKSVEARCMSRNTRRGKRSPRGSRGAKTDTRARRHSISTRWCPTLRLLQAGAPHDGWYQRTCLIACAISLLWRSPRNCKHSWKKTAMRTKAIATTRYLALTTTISPRWARWSAFPDDLLMRTHAARRVRPCLLDDDVKATSTTPTTVGQYNNEPWRRRDSTATTAGHVR